MRSQSRYYVTVVFFLFCTLFSHSQAYNYPVLPGTEAWRKLKTHDEMVFVTSIPENTLSAIKTSDLVETCFSYPLLLDVLAFNSIKAGFESVLSKFNGFQELKKRNDAGINLLEAYVSINLKKMLSDNQDIAIKGQYSIKISIYEIMLTEDQILTQLSDDQLLRLLRDVRNKMKDKAMNVEVFGTLGALTSGFVTSKILNRLKKLNLNNENLALFTKDMLLRDTKTLEHIFLTADEVLK